MPRKASGRQPNSDDLVMVYAKDDSKLSHKHGYYMFYDEKSKTNQKLSLEGYIRQGSEMNSDIVKVNEAT